VAEHPDRIVPGGEPGRRQPGRPDAGGDRRIGVIGQRRAQFLRRRLGLAGRDDVDDELRRPVRLRAGGRATIFLFFLVFFIS
jgi:hypothetical protein